MVGASVTSRDLRSFAIVVASGFTVLGLVSYWRTRSMPSHRTALAFWTIAAALVLVGLVAPRALGPFHRVWLRVGEALGWFNSRVILTLVFYGVFLPIGVVARLVGRDPLHVRSRADSYWASPQYNRKREHFKRMF